MNPKSREQLLALLAVTAVLLMVGDKFVLQPLTASWAARNKRIADLEKQVVEGAAKLDRESAISDRWKTMRVTALTNDISAAESQALRAFERWGKDANVTVSGLKPAWKRTSDREEYQTLECRADATGSLSSLARFLYQIERDPLAMKVEVVDLTTRDNEGRNLTLSLQLSGLVLTQKKNDNGAK
ncbi:MAG: hypothetical protein FJ406_04875 [Verrucomicrobia bacterium]|nr:hypothetical protein [Verrucomicrobiota bacterium]MBM3870240.1 hypothetical protein [Verrucomicrobiota bacterium]